MESVSSKLIMLVLKILILEGTQRGHTFAEPERGLPLAYLECTYARNFTFAFTTQIHNANEL